MALRRAVLSTVCSMMIWSLGGFLPGDSRNGARGFHEARGETSVMCEGERGRLPHSFEIVRALRSRARQCRCDGRPEVQ